MDLDAFSVQLNKAGYKAISRMQVGRGGALKLTKSYFNKSVINGHLIESQAGN